MVQGWEGRRSRPRRVAAKSVPEASPLINSTLQMRKLNQKSDQPTVTWQRLQQFLCLDHVHTEHSGPRAAMAHPANHSFVLSFFHLFNYLFNKCLLDTAVWRTACQVLGYRGHSGPLLAPWDPGHCSLTPPSPHTHTIACSVNIRGPPLGFCHFPVSPWYMMWPVICM